MSLTNRFSALLLATLGLTLIGFATALFVSSKIYLNRQVDDRLAAILAVLNACVDPKPAWVRWEPREKRFPPSRWNEQPASTWLVYNGEGRLLTHPKKLPLEQLTPAWAPQTQTGTLPNRVTDRLGRSWRVAQRHIAHLAPRPPGTPVPKDTDEVKSYHDSVILVAFCSLDETETTLTTLGWFLACISTVIWTTAALFARWLSRKTLVPLTRLVESARNLDATKPGWSLAEVGTNDELNDLRQAFNDLLGRLHDAYERQRRFSSEASHQLRTPVAVMIGHLEVAQRFERSSEHYLRVIQLTHRRALDLGQIVESLLFLSRVNSSTLIQTEPLNLGDWLNEFIASRPENARASDIFVNIPSHDHLWAMAQPQLLAQLVENLLDNACKYSRPGSPIRVTLSQEAGEVLLSVEDAGCGIASQDLPRVFEPFFRSTATSLERSSGVGLGLSIVERIAHACGGAVFVQSEVGQGSRFTLQLPLIPPPGRDLSPSNTLPAVIQSL